MYLKNQLLVSLSREKLSSFLPHFELVSIDIGERLIDVGEKMKYGYFPVSGVMSFIYILENGSTAEIGLVGREGFFGIPFLFGGETTPYEVIIQGKSETYRMPVNKLKELFNSSVTFRNILLLFCQIFMTQIS